MQQELQLEDPVSDVEEVLLGEHCPCEHCNSLRIEVVELRARVEELQDSFKKLFFAFFKIYEEEIHR